MIVGDTVEEDECETIEYKEFCLKKDLYKYFTDEQIRSFNYTPELNEVIIENLEHYIKYYLPKYIATFSTTNIKEAKLFIGISDNNEIPMA